ncbi:MAG: biopolymer transporter ExbD [Armatimonadetes bacterium]|nr:biopolymer transporter ExbD [Armatimonadota bacterium]
MASMRRRVALGKRRHVEEPEIIVIPMIDVMMFLLFFFMVASLAMAVQNGIPVTLPKAASGKDTNMQTLTITITKNQRVFLNTAPLAVGQLEAKLEGLGVSSRNVVTVNADAAVPHGLVIAVMDEARKAGITQFAFATSKG